MEAAAPRENPNHHGLISTHWTTVRACVGTDKVAQAAREKLCRDYWYPLYVYVKRVGYQGLDAEDLTQDFFAHILQKAWFERLDRTKGRFRAFLLASLDNFLRDRFSGLRAAKRAGSFQHIPLDLSEAATRYDRSSTARHNPTESFEIEWAAAVVDRAWLALEEEFNTAGKQHQYATLKIFLTTDGNAASYDAAALSLGTTAETVKVQVHRLRKRYGAIVQEEVARTVASPDEVPAEMRYIRDVFAEKITAAA